MIFLFGLTDEFKPHCKWKLFKKRGLIIHEYDELFLCGFMTNMWNLLWLFFVWVSSLDDEVLLVKYFFRWDFDNLQPCCYLFLVRYFFRWDFDNPPTLLLSPPYWACTAIFLIRRRVSLLIAPPPDPTFACPNTPGGWRCTWWCTCWWMCCASG